MDLLQRFRRPPFDPPPELDDLRWSDCDAQRTPTKVLLCRTSKLNDHAHWTTGQLIAVRHELRHMGGIKVATYVSAAAATAPKLVDLAQWLAQTVPPLLPHH